MARMYHPLLRPERYALSKEYEPAWVVQNRPKTNPDKRIFVPPTVIQLRMAIERIEERTKGAPRARTRALGAMHLFVQGYALCDVMQFVHAGHRLAMCRRFFQLMLKRTRPRELMRQLRIETILTYSAPGTALSACRKHLNGF